MTIFAGRQRRASSCQTRQRCRCTFTVRPSRKEPEDSKLVTPSFQVGYFHYSPISALVAPHFFFFFFFFFFCRFLSILQPLRLGSKNLPDDNLVALIAAAINTFVYRFRDYDGRADQFHAVRVPVQQHGGHQRNLLEPQLSGLLPSRHRVSLLLLRPDRRARQDLFLLLRH